MDTDTTTEIPPPGSPAAAWIAFDHSVRNIHSWYSVSPLGAPPAVRPAPAGWSAGPAATRTR
ncbi:hypothetical protein [Streptomyces sp. NPDC059566]|uniref:hypothetical protein n=1 Tax=Streptomyces sp. NPDC059566 TaxID=3346866 RepID=UPI0036B6149E